MEEQNSKRDNDSKYRLWRLAGGGALIAGIVGLTLPILPTTPFLLMAAYGFSRGSRRIHQWIVDPESLGSGFAEWRRRGMVPASGKILVLLAMLLGFLLAWVSGIETTSLIIEGVGLVLVGGYILTRPSPSPPEAAREPE